LSFVPDRRRRHSPERTHDSDLVVDADLDFRRLEIGDWCAVGLHGGEVDGESRLPFSRGARLLRRDEIRRTGSERRERADECHAYATGR
jgi:hypothetical protein